MVGIVCIPCHNRTRPPAKSNKFTEEKRMKATGIVRRIDDLGRVVIPKEIRRTMRIREGDPLEIFTDNDGEVVFKKYSPIGEMSPFASQYVEVLSKTSGLPCFVSDRDHVVASAGVSRKEYLERRISSAMEDLIEARKTYTATANDTKTLFPVEGLDRPAAVASPIISSGDVTGAVVMLMGDSGSMPNEVDIKLAQTASAFLGRLMEE